MSGIPMLRLMFKADAIDKAWLYLQRRF